jgi:hypothetical protein
LAHLPYFEATRKSPKKRISLAFETWLNNGWTLTYIVFGVSDFLCYRIQYTKPSAERWDHCTIPQGKLATRHGFRDAMHAI